MISSLKDRQGFNTGLSGVSGTSVQTAFTKPILAPGYAAENISWLPFPYGPLPDVGPWAKNGDLNEKEEHPIPETPTEEQPWKAENSLLTEYAPAFIIGVVVISVYVLVKYMPGGYH